MQYNAPFGNADPTAGYVNGNPSTGTAGSIPPAAALEYTQREIVNTIAAAGLTPNNLDLTQLMQAVRGGALSYFGDSGTQNLLIINPNPAYTNYFVGMTLTVKPAFGNTGPSTINVNGISPVAIVKKGGTPLVGGEWSSGDVIELKHNGTAFQLVGGGAMSGGANFQSWARAVAGNYSYLVPIGVSLILAGLWGAGGSGAGVTSSTGVYATPCGGGGGGYAETLLVVTGGQSIPCTIGAGGARPAAGQNPGIDGGTTSFLSLSATGGKGASVTTGPTPGGLGYGGALNLKGGVGRGGAFVANPGGGSNPTGGDGGSSWCSGPVPYSQGAQHDGEQPGQGGSGASTLNNTAVAGGAGSDGMIIIRCVG